MVEFVRAVGRLAEQHKTGVADQIHQRVIVLGSAGQSMGRTAHRFRNRRVSGARCCGHLLGMSEQLADLLIRGLSEVLVPVADSVKGFRCDRADDLVDLGSQLFTGLGRCRRYRHNDPGRFALPQCLDGRAHRGTGRQPVIDQDHGPTMHIERRTTTAISTLAPRQLVALLRLDPVDHIVRNTQVSDDLLVEDARAAGRNGTHCELFVARDAELADDEDVQRRPERAGYFIRDRHTATRQCQYDHIRPIGVGGELCCQQPPRFPAITEAFGCHISPLPWPPDRSITRPPGIDGQRQ